jgi:hypothetical protein
MVVQVVDAFGTDGNLVFDIYNGTVDGGHAYLGIFRSSGVGSVYVDIVDDGGFIPGNDAVVITDLSPGFDGVVMLTWVRAPDSTTAWVYLYDDTGSPVDSGSHSLISRDSPIAADLVEVQVSQSTSSPVGHISRVACYPCAKTQAEADALALEWTTP